MEALPGLSTAHIVTGSFAPIASVEVQEGGVTVHRRKYPARVVMYDGGSKLEVKREHWRVPQVGGGRRGAVREFSKNSRRRLMRKVAELRRDTFPVFCTLTYPGVFPTESKVYKEHLRVFGIYLRRAYKRAAFIWRLEFQKRGAPHYHCLIYNVPCSGRHFKEFKLWLSETWYKIVKSGDERHLRAGTNAERLQSFKRVMGYVSKAVAHVANGEIGKEEQATQEDVGRWWGYVGAENLPLADKFSLVILEARAIALIRYMRRFAKLQARAYKSLTVFCDCSAWVKQLPMLLFPDEEPAHKRGSLRSPIFAR